MWKHYSLQAVLGPHTESGREPLQAASTGKGSKPPKKPPAHKPPTWATKPTSEEKKKAAEQDSDMENVDDVKPEPEVAVVEEKVASGIATKVEESKGGDMAGHHPEYGAPPHPDAEIAMIGSKAVWQFINDKGEEVTVVRSACSFAPQGTVVACKVIHLYHHLCTRDMHVYV
jgi:hypothetical protein